MWTESSDNSDLESSGPCQLAHWCSGQSCDQEGMQESSRMPMGTSEHECAPLLCRLRLNHRDQDSSNIMLQDYRRIVTIIRQEDVGLDVHDNCSLRPYVCGSSCHMPRDKESSTRKKTKPQTPAPKGAIGQADDRAKADKEAQHLERDQAKQRAIQLVATGSAKASIGSRDAASDTSTKPKTAKKTDKSTSSIEASTLEIGDTPTPKTKATVRKRPAQLDEESLRLESGALPPTPAESETSQNPAASEPSQADKAIDGAQSSRAMEQSNQEPSNIRRRVSKKGATVVGSRTGIYHRIEE